MTTENMKATWYWKCTKCNEPDEQSSEGYSNRQDAVKFLMAHQSATGHKGSGVITREDPDGNQFQEERGL